jgi:hypothetical protein
MGLNSLLSNICWIPVVVMTIFSFVLGFVWHQPFLFGRRWKRENNPDNLPVKINALLVFGGTTVLHFIAIAGLSAFISGMGGAVGSLTGFGISIVWMLPSMFGTYVFANRSIGLLAIDAGMYVVLFTVSGFVLGIW